MLPWRPQAVSNRYFYSKESIKHFSKTHRTDRTSTSLSIGLSRTSDTSPVQYLAPRQGKKKGLSLRSFGKKKKLRMLKLPSVQQQEWKKQMKVLPQGNVSLKSWKRRNVPWRKRMTESERSSRKNLEDSELSRKPNVEPESNVRGIPEYKYQLPARRRREKPGSSGKLRNWWRTISSRTARSRRSRRKPQKHTPQHVRTPNRPRKTSYLHFRKLRRRLKYCRNVWEEPWKLQWLSAAKRSVPSSTLRPKTSVRAQKYRELKPDLRSLLDSKKESGKRELRRKSLVNLGRRKDLKYQRQPSQDHSGEFVLESNQLKKNQERNGEKRFLKMSGRLEDCTYYPFSPEWQEKLREELLTLANRGFAKKEDGELYPTRRFGWQLKSTREFESINQSLERDYGVRLVWKSQEVKGKSKSVDDFHCYPIGRGKMEKVSKFGVQYTVLGTLPPNKSMCSICWSEGHWKSGCQLKDMVFELWEPSLVVLVPAERLRKYYPCRNIVCERYQHDKDNDSQYFYPAIAFADYGAVSSQISEINSKRYKDAKLRSPEEYPEIEPPEDEREERPVLSTEQAMEYAASKKAAKPSDPEQRMASHSETLLDMQDQAKKRRAKLLEKESKQKAIDVDDESTSKKEESASKKARGKGQGSESGIWTKEPLPAGHWQDRPRRESLPSESQETKDALRQKLEAHKKEQLEEYHKKKLRETFETHLKKETSGKEEEPAARKGPGPDEAGSDPSSEEESESSSATDDPDGATNLE